MSAGTWRVLRLVVGLAILVLLTLELGSGPFLSGLRATDPRALVVALLVTAVTTWCCAHRWALVSEWLGTPPAAGSRYRAYYRSQLVNATLPGGVLGDLDRGVRHGLRPVVWERGLGQVVQVCLTLVALVVVASPLRWTAGLVAPVAVVAVAVLVAATRGRARRRPRPPGVGLGPRLVLLSGAAVAGHVVLFLVAARTAGVTEPLRALVPVAMLVLLASAVPTNVAGWGPREGMAAWAFGAAGLGADVGLTVAVTYGVMSMVATLPGLLVIAAPARARTPAVRSAGIGASHG